MAINFPSGPIVGQLYSFANVVWEWSGEYWGLFTGQTGNGSGGSGGSGIFVPLSGGIMSGALYTPSLISPIISGGTLYGDGSNLTNIPDRFVTGFTFNQANYDLTIKRNGGLPDLTQSLSILATDMTITGGTYNSSTGTATFVNNSGGTFQVTGFIKGFTDVYTTGATYNDQTKIATFTTNSGSTYTLDLTSLSALTTQQIYITEYSYDKNSNAFTIKDSSGSTFTTAFSEVTGLTVNGILNVLSSSNEGINLGSTNTTSDQPIDIKLGNTNTKGIRIYASDDQFDLSKGGDIEIYSNQSATYPGQVLINTGADDNSALIFRTAKSLQPLVEMARFSSSGNLLLGTSTDSNFKLDVNGTSRFSDVVQLDLVNQTLDDVKILTLSSGNTIQYRDLNDFVFSTNYLSISGGTVTGDVIFQSGITATTIYATTYENLPVSFDTYVTGFTYDNSNTFTILDNSGNTLNATINEVTGLTVNGVLIINPATGQTYSVINFSGDTFIHNYGIGNTFVGTSAGSLNGTGSDNTGFGDFVLNNLDNGDDNTGIGSLALTDLTGGTFNTALGAGSLQNLVYGDNNTGVGVGSNAQLLSGGGNTSIGFQTLFNNTDGSDNVAIGNKAGFNGTGSNKLYIANNDSTTLIYGEFDNQKVGINTTSPTNTFHVSGSTDPVRFEGLQLSGDTRILTSDNDGVIRYRNYSDFTGSTVTITGGTNIQVTGSYPNFGINFTGTTGVSGDYLPLSGGTVTGDVIFQSGITANIISGGTLYGDGSNLTGIQSQNIYNTDGSLNSNRIVDLSSFTLNFSSSTNPDTLVLNNGNVGIGTTSPGAPLHINSTAVPSTNETIFRGTVSDVPGAYIDLRNGSTTNGNFVAQLIGRQASGSFSSALFIDGFIESNTDSGNNSVSVFRVAKISGSTISQLSGRTLYDFRNWTNSVMVIDSLGDVGIGTTSPTNKLHVSGSTDPVRFVGLQSNSTDNRILSSDSNGVIRYRNFSDFTGSTVTITGGTNIQITGSYPNFGVNYTGQTDFPYLALSGGTVTGDVTFQSGITANIISGGTFYGDGSNLTGIVTSITTGSGLSGNSTNGNITLVNTSPDQTVTVTGGTNIQITGSYPNFGINYTGQTDFPYLPLSGGTVTGDVTFQSGITASTIYATTYQNLPVTKDTYTTGGTYTNSTSTLNLFDNSGNTISITGFTKYFISGSTPIGIINYGDRWYNTNEGIELVYINDGNSDQWVQPANTPGPPGYSNLMTTSGITTSDVVLDVDTNYYGVTYSGNVNLTLPTPSGYDGYSIRVKDEKGNAGIYRIRVNTVSGLIDGNSYVDMNINYISLTFVARNGNWWII